MASPRPKSPRTPVSTKKEEKEESFWDKIGTLGRKKRIKEGIIFNFNLFCNNLKRTNFARISLHRYLIMLMSLYGAGHVMRRMTRTTRNGEDKKLFILIFFLIIFIFSQINSFVKSM
jgi:hypothetical protein